MAFNSAGEGPESERYLERTFRKAPQKPPASVNVWAYNPTTVRVVWRYVQPTDEEEPLLGYKVTTNLTGSLGQLARHTRKDTTQLHSFHE